MNQSQSLANIQDLQSSGLKRNFKMRLRRHNRTLGGGDDALKIIRRNSDQFKSIIDNISIIGNFPWEQSIGKVPQILFSTSFFPNESIIPFVFPNGRRYFKKSYKNVVDVMSDTFSVDAKDLTHRTNSSTTTTTAKNNNSNNNNNNNKSNNNCSPTKKYFGKKTNGNVNNNSFNDGDDDIFEDSFVTLFFPENTNSPYLFCYKYFVSPLTIPSITHNLSLPELFSYVSAKTVPYGEICIAIQTKLPYETLFREMIDWILSCEKILRNQNADQIETFLLNGEIEGNDEEVNVQLVEVPEYNSILISGELLTPSAVSAFSPDQQQSQADTIQSFSVDFSRKLNDILKRAINMMPPMPNNKIVLDYAPFPLFEWMRPMSAKNYFPLARSCIFELVSRISPRAFAMILSALSLEKTVIFYDKNPEVVSKVVLAAHFLLRPLRWISGSISIIPTGLKELFNAPNPFIIGTIEEPPKETFSDSTAVVVDLLNNEISTTEKIPELPYFDNLVDEVEEIWYEISEKNDTKLNRIIMAANLAVRDILGPAEASIISDFTEISLTTSKFHQELYLSQFERKNRPFLKAFSETQMFYLHIEQECRKRSDSIRYAPLAKTAPLIKCDGNEIGK